MTMSGQQREAWVAEPLPYVHSPPTNWPYHFTLYSTYV